MEIDEAKVARIDAACLLEQRKVGKAMQELAIRARELAGDDDTTAMYMTSMATMLTHVAVEVSDFGNLKPKARMQRQMGMLVRIAYTLLASSIDLMGGRKLSAILKTGQRTTFREVSKQIGRFRNGQLGGEA